MPYTSLRQNGDTMFDNEEGTPDTENPSWGKHVIRQSGDADAAVREQIDIKGATRKMVLYPDTGHHYVTIPVATEKDKNSGEIKKYFALGERKWWTSADYPWMRFRMESMRLKIGQKWMDNVYCFIICVESNAGRHPERARGLRLPNELDSGDLSRNIAPYAHPSLQHPADNIKLYIGVEGIVGIHVEIEWARGSANDTGKVDLVVDFGNSRTTAALLELPEPNAQFSVDTLQGKISPLFFPKRNQKGDIDAGNERDCVVDSWFMLHEPHFTGVEFCGEPTERLATVNNCDGLSGGPPPSTDMNLLLVDTNDACYKTPQMFVELAPVLIGAEAADTLDTYAEHLSSEPILLSSPKRYSWDKTPRKGGENWAMLQNKWNGNKTAQLQGNVLRFMRGRSRDWNENNPALEEQIEHSPHKMQSGMAPDPYPSQARHPRRDMLTLMALNLLEHAWLQLGARARKEAEEAPGTAMRRKLRNIWLTYPAGWTADELESYKRCWQRAVDIFTLNHLDCEAVNPKGIRPKLRMELDEAVATQLPLVFDGLCEMGNNISDWLDFYGKTHEKTDGNGQPASVQTVRVMSFDIGGGTCDCAVVEYSKKGRRDVEYNVLLKDSNQEAGDNILKNLIQSIVLSKMRATIIDDISDKTKRAKAERLFDLIWSGEDERKTGVSQVHRSFLARKLLIPAAEYLLQNFSREKAEIPPPKFTEEALKKLKKLWENAALNEEVYNEGGGSRFSTDGKGNDAEGSLERTLKSFIGSEDGKKAVTEKIEDVLGKSMSFLAGYVKRFDVDLLILSGRPSEMDCVRRLVEDKVPLSRNRCLHAKGLRIGKWYPFAKDGKVADAKNINLAGLALYSLVESGRMGGNLNIVRKETADERHGAASGGNFTNEWFVHEDGQAGKDDIRIEFDSSGVAEVHMMTNNSICRRMPGSESRSPVYKLLFFGEREGKLPEFSIRLRKTVANGRERITAESYRLADNQELDRDILDNLSLELFMIEGESHWIDKATFTISTT
jgi:hypothetical protein